jgi:hypothetical protein
LRMKLNAALAKTLLMAASIGMVVPVLAQNAPSAPAQKAKPGSKPSTPAKPVEEKKEPAVEGIEIARSKGGFLGLALEDGRWVLRFYDDKKEQIAPDVARANARWNPPNRVNDERTVLNPTGDGKTLKAPLFVQGPRVFPLFLTLLAEDGSAVESYRVSVQL